MTRVGVAVPRGREVTMRPYRRERLGSLIRELVSEVLSRHMQDPRIAALTTVTRVEVSGDLQVAKVYLSVPGQAVDERKTLAALEHATGHVQGLVARDLQIRQCPQLRFLVDPRVRGTRRTLELLEQNRLAKPEAFLPEAPAGEQGPDGGEVVGPDAEGEENLLEVEGSASEDVEGGGSLDAEPTEGREA